MERKTVLYISIILILSTLVFPISIFFIPQPKLEEAIVIGVLSKAVFISCSALIAIKMLGISSPFKPETSRNTHFFAVPAVIVFFFFIQGSPVEIREITEKMFYSITGYGFILNNVLTGIYEELAVRVVLLALLFRYFPEGRVVRVVFLCALLFALLHLPRAFVAASNLSSGINFMMMVFGLGFLLTAIMVRTNNFFALAGMHALINIASNKSYLIPSEVIEKASTEFNFGSILVCLVIGSVLVYVGYAMVKNRKIEETEFLRIERARETQEVFA